VATLRFHLIAEAEARQIPEGATVELEPGGHVTPLARRDSRRSRAGLSGHSCCHCG
jgi:hypothetical protein